MGILDLFKSKPEPCSACGSVNPRLHRYKSGYFKDQPDEAETRLCTPCLILRLGEALKCFSAQCALIEPMTQDNYVFLRFADDKFQSLMAEPLGTYFSAQHNCVRCGREARFVWLPLDVLDDSDNRGRLLKYKPISAFPDYKHLCAEHLVQEFASFLEQKNFHFASFRPPVGTLDGYMS